MYAMTVNLRVLNSHLVALLRQNAHDTSVPNEGSKEIVDVGCDRAAPYVYMKRGQPNDEKLG
jgi:hypothetical protein